MENEKATGAQDDGYRLPLPLIVALIVSTLMVVAARFGALAASGVLGENIVAQALLVVGAGAGVLLFPTMVGWLAYRATERSRGAGYIAFAVVLVAAVASQVYAAMASLETRPESASASATIEEGPVPTREDINALLNREVRESQANVLAVIGAWSDEGGLDFSGIRTREDLLYREQLRGEAQTAIETYMEEIETTGERVHSLLKQRGMQDGEIAAFMEGFDEGFSEHKQALLEIRRQDILLLQKTERLHEILDAHWGEWEINGASGRIEFLPAVPRETADEFRQCLAAIAVISAHQAELQQRQLEAATSTQTPRE
ncbi:MAG: hypothetical protein PWP23_2620 [Candidatus Sumerlaeota bacterium]|nr:hypothetical protein [Candidatus Sumerlaeota bacterium]